MARTIKEIKKGMTDQFMADPVMREKYGLSETDTFDSAFSLVSVESILFDIVAAAAYVLESIFDIFRKEVDGKVATAVVGTIPWYHRICLEYQHGDALVLNEATCMYEYPKVDESKRIIRYAACRDFGGGIYILVAGADAEGHPAALSNDVLTAFTEYVGRRKPAGIIADIYTSDPDDITISMTVQYDPMLMNADGSLIADPAVHPVKEAVNAYLAGIAYGGTFNKTRLTDAVQAAEGVVDLQLGQVMAKRADADTYTEISGNNYQSKGGSFRSADLGNTISYVLEI
ncbi:MAG: hypothetical protein E7112_00755 [Bacteroidales bacterium]|nr:hypothetical protein [Bacteroidales bacterium]